MSDTDVSVLGWGSKGGGTPIPFETPHVHDGSTTTSGFTSIFHRLPDGIEVVITYDSFVLDRRVVRTGRNACAMTVTATLRPGHTVFEVHGISNHEQMTEVTRVYTGLSCAFPKLLGLTVSLRARRDCAAAALPRSVRTIAHGQK